MQLATKCSRWLNTYIIVRAAIWSAPSCCGTSVALCAHPITFSLSESVNGNQATSEMESQTVSYWGQITETSRDSALLVKTLALNTWNVMGVSQLKQKTGIKKVIVFMVKQPPLLMIIYLHDSGRNHGRLIRIFFTLCSCYVHRSPLSLSDSLLEVKGRRQPNEIHHYLE